MAYSTTHPNVFGWVTGKQGDHRTRAIAEHFGDAAHDEALHK